jgi:hypothetical protein
MNQARLNERPLARRVLLVAGSARADQTEQVTRSWTSRNGLGVSIDSTHRD